MIRIKPINSCKSYVSPIHKLCYLSYLDALIFLCDFLWSSMHVRYFPGSHTCIHKLVTTSQNEGLRRYEGKTFSYELPAAIWTYLDPQPIWQTRGLRGKFSERVENKRIIHHMFAMFLPQIFPAGSASNLAEEIRICSPKKTNPRTRLDNQAPPAIRASYAFLSLPLWPLHILSGFSHHAS